MKIERQIGILSILLQKEKVTAPELAQKFEVSRRTINRDIENLCKAGIPIVTEQGARGGISIMDGYKIDKTLLTSSDLQAILTGLRSLDSVSGTNRYGQLMEKLEADSSDLLTGDQNMLIDLSSWYKDALAPKIEQIRTGIEQAERIAFTYYSPAGETEREVEPYYLIFQWANWYLWAWCCRRQDFRIFKLNRMLHLRSTGMAFSRREAPPPDLSAERRYPPVLQVKALFTPECKWRLIEEFGAESFLVQEDGRLLFSFGFTDEANLLQWILSFGEKVKLLEPESLRRKLWKTGTYLCHTYEEGKER